MRTHMSFFVTFLLGAAIAFSANLHSAALQDAEISESEKRQAVEFAKSFWQGLQGERDLARYLAPAAALLGQSFLSETLDEFGFPDTISRKLSREQLERFFITGVNLTYLSELHLWGTLPLEKHDSADQDQRFPPEAAALIRSLKSEQDVHSLEEFEEFIKTQERAIDSMRAAYRVAPPEQTKQFEKNVAKVQRDILQPAIMIEKFGVGYPVGTRYLRINVPLLTLILLPAQDGIKIVLVTLWAD